MELFAIAVAVGVPLATLILGAFTFFLVHNKADGKQVERLEDKVERIQQSLDDCVKERLRLERREIELMRQLLEKGE